MAPKVLIVLTSADKIVKLDKPTGWYLVSPSVAATISFISALPQYLFTCHPANSPSRCPVLLN
jgi:hypothetical protein